MTRRAKAGQTVDDLKALVERASDPDYGACPYGIINGDSPAGDVVRDDLSEIEVDFENVEAFGGEDSYDHLPGLESLDGYEMLGSGASAFPVLWCAGGGDWEYPVAFVLYMGDDGRLRAYIPDDGNVYNRENKAAFGNSDDDPDYDSDDPRLEFDAGKMRADVARRIIVAE